LACLLVIVPDRISDILTKGEYQPCYYNPGQVFDEVHILTTTDDSPCLVGLQKTVGCAKLKVHSLPEDSSLAGKQPGLLAGRRLRRWAKSGVELAQRIRPALIRCHGADWNTYLASRIKTELGIPYVVSLHINPDVNAVRRYVRPPFSKQENRHNAFYSYIEKQGLSKADLVMPVYRPIVSYLERLGIKRFQVCYNVLNSVHLQEKKDYALHKPARIIYVGRLIADKNPANIIRALALIPEVLLTIVGDGPIRQELEKLVSDLGVTERVNFLPSVLNDDVCRLLPDQDVFVVHSEYWEISKSVLEALLTGLPVIINRRHGDPVPELEGEFVLKVENTVEGYSRALQLLLSDHAFREQLGRKAFAYARSHWSPEITEAKYADIYRSFLQRRNGY